MSRLTNKVVFLTGATGGIGEAIAERFLREGAKLMLVGRSADKLKATTAKLAGGDNIASFVSEADDEAGIRGAVDATLDAFGRLDICIANAGTEGHAKPFETQTMEEFSQVISVNVVGVWLAMKYCVAHMRKAGGGSMICMSSVAGLKGFPGLSPYTASKHAVCGLVKTIAMELGEAGIRVNAIAPGPIDNRMIASLEAQLSPDDPAGMRAAIEEKIPLKRYGTEDEVANMALFLASDESEYCTGTIFNLDGGLTAG
jgi:NAD(P)-dependent dehydrogenase (short-subunit alcohol dehydrogenase family)